MPKKGYKQTEEHRKNNFLANKGRTLSLEHKKKIGLGLLGNQNPKGKKCSEQRRKKLIGNKYALGFSHSEEAKKRISNAMKTRIISEETRKKLSVARLKQKLPFKDTSIEVKLQNILKEKEIKFSTHYPILGQPDIFIEPNLCVFADGDYWHNLPGRKEKDAEINQKLKEDGYSVIRLWEHEIIRMYEQHLNERKRFQP